MKYYRYLFMVLVLLVVNTSQAWAQTAAVVTGKVSELFNGKSEPLMGVNVQFVNASNRSLGGAITNLDGNFNIQVPKGEKNLTLVFSYIGMKTQRIKFNGQSQLNVVMQSDSHALSDVEVVASRVDRNNMGITQKEMISSTQKVDMDDIVMNSPVTSVEEALQGQLAGVDILTGGGDPGAKGSIRIRGTSTLNSNAEPLIVIDGVPYTDDLDDNYDWANSNNEDLSALLNLSPTDIKSVEVLKDASATAIWGTRGANGVLVITTKSGSRVKTSFSFSSKYTAKFEPESIPMLNGDQYTALMQEAIWNAGNYKGLGTGSSTLELLYNTPQIGYDPSYTYFDEYNQNTDWLNEVRKTAMKWENNFSMSGGGEKATYRFSLGYLTDGGTTIGTNLTRFNTALKITYDFSDKLRFYANFSYTESNQDANYYTNVRSEAMAAMPNKSPYYIDDTTKERTDNYFSYNSDYEGAFKDGSNYNAVAMARESENSTRSREGKLDLHADYKILPGFTYSGLVSLKLRGIRGHKFLPQSAIGVAWTDSYANRSTDSSSDNYSLQTENKLMFIKNWKERHQLIATGVLRTSQSRGTSYSSTTSGNASPGLSDPIIGSSVAGIGSGESESRSISSIFQANYTLLDRYVFQGTVSMEGNSAMGEDNRWGLFPAGGVSWNAHYEPFLRDVDWVDEVKLRAAVGQSGNTAKGTSYFGAYSAISGGYMDMPAIEPTRMQLNSLKWETTTEYNVGTDLGFFKNRLRFTVDYYHKFTKDLLQSGLSIPSTTGYSKLNYFNSGKMENYGWEARADVVMFENKKWKVSGYVNLSHNENKITELPSTMSQNTYDQVKNGQYASIIAAGRPVGSFYGFRYLGVYMDEQDTYARSANGKVMNDLEGKPIVMQNDRKEVTPGDAKYEDINHDGVINKYDIVYLGNYNPLLTGGWGLSIRYDRFTLRADFYGRIGSKIINKARMDNESMYNKNNQSTAVLNRWKKIGDNTDIPRALYNDGLNYLGSDRFVEDNSYMRLKTLSLSYSLPKTLCNRIGFNTMSCFVTGYNLFTWTNYTGQDPEVKIPGKPTSFAMDTATTPCSIQLSCGVNLSF